MKYDDYDDEDVVILIKEPSIRNPQQCFFFFELLFSSNFQLLLEM